MSKSKVIPYENAISGANAREEITKLLQAMKCSQVGFMDDFENQSVILAFTHRGRNVQLKASAKGWAQMFLRERPYSSRMRCTLREYEVKAHKQGLVAINSILRDWVKGQVTAVECGILSFEDVFMPHLMLPNGKTLREHVVEAKLLTGIEETNG